MWSVIDLTPDGGSADDRDWIDVTVTLANVAQPSADDLAAHMVTTDHGVWAQAWPDPRERWRWCRWMSRAGTDEQDLTTPPFELDGVVVRLRARATAAALAEYSLRLRGHDLD